MKLQLVVALCAVFVASQANAAEKIQLKTEKDKINYTKAYRMTKGVMQMLGDFDQKIITKAIQDALSGAEPLLTAQDMVTAEEAFQKERAAKQQEQNRILAEKNKKAADAFLAENAKKEGVKTLPSGLQYKVITGGKGKKPTVTDKVAVKYRCTLIDGTVFDSSEQHSGEEPTIIPVRDKSLMDGWTEGIQLMSEGSKFQLVMPPSLGFKDKSMAGIGPNSVLIFEVELVSIQKAGKAEKAEEKKKN